MASRLYAEPHQFEPLLPEQGARDALLAKASEVFRLAATVSGRADAAVLQALRPLLRAMNSYYTNRIEGQHTRPAELEQALRQEFSANHAVQRLQRVALAHLDAEAWAEQAFAQRSWAELTSADVLCALHRQLFAGLPPEDRLLKDGSAFEPGALRTPAQQVQVGQHQAPDAVSVPAFLARFAEVYGTVRPGELALVAVAAAHHRLAWVHPFADGNGRVARLHSHVLLQAMGLTNGIWSPMRGLARSQGRYYEHLGNADLPRAGDLDGRGNLTQRGLVAFVDYFLDVCLDQVQFMARMLDMATMRERVRACVLFEAAQPGSGVPATADLALHTLFLHGQMPRDEFKRLLAPGLRNAQRHLSALLARRLVVSDSPRAPVRFGVPFSALRFYFPALWPEAEA
jgi:Fic family protein